MEGPATGPTKPSKDSGRGGLKFSHEIEVEQGIKRGMILKLSLKRTQSPSADEWINKPWSIHKLDYYYPAIKRIEAPSHAVIEEP